MIPYSQWRPIFKSALAALHNIQVDPNFRDINECPIKLNAFTVLFYDVENPEQAMFLLNGAPKVGRNFLNKALEVDKWLEQCDGLREYFKFDGSATGFQMLAGTVERMNFADYQIKLPPHLRMSSRLVSFHLRTLDVAIAGQEETDIIAVEGSAIIGTVCVRHPNRKDTSADLRRLYVRPEYRRNGVGLALVNAACEVARGSGAATVALLLQLSNDALRETFYAKAGFAFCYQFPSGDLQLVRFLGSQYSAPVGDKAEVVG